MKSNGSKRQPKNHNAAKWLEVVYLDAGEFNLPFEPGWYVIRVCPCHFREPVTMAYPNKGRAEHARRVILRASEVLGEPT